MSTNISEVKTLLCRDKEMEAEVKKAMKAITGKSNATINEVFAVFENLNINPIKEKRTKTENKMVEQKNLICRNQVFLQVEKTRNFNAKEFIPFKNVCKKCSGFGELFRFLRSETTVKCKACKPGHKCFVCGGTKKYKKFPLFPAMESHNICLSCNGLGYHPVKEEKEPDNPVLDKTIAEQIVVE